MQTQSVRPNVLIAGTGAVALVAHRHYAPVREAVPDLSIFTLAQGGLLKGVTETCCDILSRLTSQYGEQPLNLIGDSQGGLVAAWLTAHHPTRFPRTVTLGAPWGGTKLAPSWFPILAALPCMAPGSAFLCELQAAIQAALQGAGKPEIHSIYAAGDWFLPGDGLVWPSRSSCLPGAYNYLVVREDLQAELLPRLPTGIKVLTGKANHFSLLRQASVLQLLASLFVPTATPTKVLVA